jgi:hypothetical protein
MLQTREALTDHEHDDFPRQLKPPIPPGRILDVSQGIPRQSRVVREARWQSRCGRCHQVLHSACRFGCFNGVLYPVYLVRTTTGSVFQKMIIDDYGTLVPMKRWVVVSGCKYRDH